MGVSGMSIMGGSPLRILLLMVAVSMVVAHESGHILITRLLGGRFRGVVFRGWAIGVQLTVDGLSPQSVAWTLLAGPLAEALVFGAAVATDLRNAQWWALLLFTQWIVNLVPWGVVPNDGTRLWQLWQQCRRAAMSTKP